MRRNLTAGLVALCALTALSSPLRAQTESIVLTRPDGPLIYATVEPEPFIRIGESYGAAEYRFGTSVVPLLRSGDSVLAAVRWQADLRLFDSAGRFVRHVGRTGDPSVASRPSLLLDMPDGAFGLYDEITSTMEWYGSDGLRRRMDTVPRVGPAVFGSQGTSGQTIVAALPDGGLFLYRLGSQAVSNNKRLTSRFGEDSIFFYHLSADFGTVTQVGRFFGRRYFQHWVPEDRTMYWDDAFEQRTLFAAHDSLLFVADTRSRSLVCVSPAGEIVRRYTLPEAAPLSAELKEQIKRAVAQRSPLLSALIDRRTHPDSVPFFTQLIVDAEGMMWFRSHASEPDDDARTRWFVYRSDGSYQGAVILPTSLTVNQITKDRVVGVVHSFMADSRVEVYRLVRS